jgi:hypothetical protein
MLNLARIQIFVKIMLANDFQNARCRKPCEDNEMMDSYDDAMDTQAILA